LADALTPQVLDGAVVLAVPPGGMPVAWEIAAKHALPLDLFFVERLTLPDRDERIGSIAWGGASVLDRRVIDRSGLPPRELRQLKRQKLETIRQRARKYGVRVPDIEARAAVLVDEGMVSGSTMLAAVKALRRRGALTITIMVPAAPGKAVLRLINEVDLLFCLHIMKDDDIETLNAYSMEREYGEPEAFALWAGAANKGQNTRNPYHTVQSSSGIPYDR
jgi:predicted phosphoribosyltransferase